MSTFLVHTDLFIDMIVGGVGFFRWLFFLRKCIILSFFYSCFFRCGVFLRVFCCYCCCVCVWGGGGVVR